MDEAADHHVAADHGAKVGGAAGGDEAAPAADAPGGADGAPVSQESVITTGDATLVADDPIKALTRVVAAAESVGGRADSREQHAASGGDDAWATVTLRIPSDDMSTVLDTIGEIGEIASLTQSSENVTLTVRDLEARIKAARASVDRVEQLLATATSTAELISIESELSSRQANLESLEAQKAYLDEQVALSTLTVTITTPDDVVIPPKKDPSTFLDGLGSGWDALTGFIGVVLVVLGVLLPWLVLAAIPTVIGIRVHRARRRSAAARAAAQPHPAPLPPMPVPPTPPVPPAPPVDAAQVR